MEDIQSVKLNEDKGSLRCRACSQELTDNLYDTELCDSCYIETFCTPVDEVQETFLCTSERYDVVCM